MWVWQSSMKCVCVYCVVFSQPCCDTVPPRGGFSSAEHAQFIHLSSMLLYMLTWGTICKITYTCTHTQAVAFTCQMTSVQPPSPLFFCHTNLIMLTKIYFFHYTETGLSGTGPGAKEFIKYLYNRHKTTAKRSLMARNRRKTTKNILLMYAKHPKGLQRNI